MGRKKRKQNKIGLLGLPAMALIATFAVSLDQVKAETDFEPTGNKVYAQSGYTSYRRRVASSIGIYAKKGTVPGLRRFNGSYGGVHYEGLEIDASDESGTFLKVDFAGDSPQYINNFYDKDLTSNNEYYWVGAINAGFFNNTTSSSEYGYPTGAVRENYAWDKYKGIDCAPSYGAGFVTQYLNHNQDAKLIYNGWKNSTWYDYAGDTDPQPWEEGEHFNYEDGVSGAYTLLVDGSRTHWGKGDYNYVDYWTYGGTTTLFGQKADGNYIMVVADGTLSGDQQTELMASLGCTNGIRFDGGGSSSINWDPAMVVDHYFLNIEPANRTFAQNDTFDPSIIRFDVYDGDGQNYHYAQWSDAPQASYTITNTSGSDVTSSFPDVTPGQYNLNVFLNGMTQTISLSVTEQTVNRYQVTIDSGIDGSSPSIITVDEGTKISDLDVPTWIGHRFTGWVDSNSKPLTDDTEINSDMTIKGTWEALAIKAYKVECTNTSYVSGQKFDEDTIQVTVTYEDDSSRLLDKDEYTLEYDDSIMSQPDGGSFDVVVKALDGQTIGTVTINVKSISSTQPTQIEVLETPLILKGDVVGDDVSVNDFILKATNAWGDEISLDSSKITINIDSSSVGTNKIGTLIYTDGSYQITTSFNYDVIEEEFVGLHASTDEPYIVYSEAFGYREFDWYAVNQRGEKIDSITISSHDITVSAPHDDDYVYFTLIYKDGDKEYRSNEVKVPIKHRLVEMNISSNLSETARDHQFTAEEFTITGTNEMGNAMTVQMDNISVHQSLSGNTYSVYLEYTEGDYTLRSNTVSVPLNPDSQDPILTSINITSKHESIHFNEAFGIADFTITPIDQFGQTMNRILSISDLTVVADYDNDNYYFTIVYKNGDTTIRSNTVTVPIIHRLTDLSITTNLTEVESGYQFNLDDFQISGTNEMENSLGIDQGNVEIVQKENNACIDVYLKYTEGDYVLHSNTISVPLKAEETPVASRVQFILNRIVYESEILSADDFDVVVYSQFNTPMTVDPSLIHIESTPLRAGTNKITVHYGELSQEIEINAKALTYSIHASQTAPIPSDATDYSIYFNVEINNELGAYAFDSDDLIFILNDDTSMTISYQDDVSGLLSTTITDVEFETVDTYHLNVTAKAPFPPFATFTPDDFTIQILNQNDEVITGIEFEDISFNPEYTTDGLEEVTVTGIYNGQIITGVAKITVEQRVANSLDVIQLNDFTVYSTPTIDDFDIEVKDQFGGTLDIGNNCRIESINLIADQPSVTIIYDDGTAHLTQMVNVNVVNAIPELSMNSQITPEMTDGDTYSLVNIPVSIHDQFGNVIDDLNDLIRFEPTIAEYGDDTVTVTLEGYEATLNVTVNISKQASQLTTLEATSNIDIYEEGHPFTTDDFMFNGLDQYGESMDIDLSKITFDPSVATLNTNSVNILYDGRFMTSVDISVEETLRPTTIDSTVDSLDFYVGDSIDTNIFQLLDQYGNTIQVEGNWTIQPGTIGVDTSEIQVLFTSYDGEITLNQNFVINNMGTTQPTSMNVVPKGNFVDGQNVTVDDFTFEFKNEKGYPVTVDSSRIIIEPSTANFYDPYVQIEVSGTDIMEHIPLNVVKAESIPTTFTAEPTNEVYPTDHKFSQEDFVFTWYDQYSDVMTVTDFTADISLMDADNLQEGENILQIQVEEFGVNATVSVNCEERKLTTLNATYNGTEDITKYSQIDIDDFIVTGTDQFNNEMLLDQSQFKLTLAYKENVAVATISNKSVTTTVEIPLLDPEYAVQTTDVVVVTDGEAYSLINVPLKITDQFGNVVNDMDSAIRFDPATATFGDSDVVIWLDNSPTSIPVTVNKATSVPTTIQLSEQAIANGFWVGDDLSTMSGLFEVSDQYGELIDSSLGKFEVSPSVIDATTSTIDVKFTLNDVSLEATLKITNNGERPVESIFTSFVATPVNAFDEGHVFKAEDFQITAYNQNGEPVELTGLTVTFDPASANSSETVNITVGSNQGTITQTVGYEIKEPAPSNISLKGVYTGTPVQSRDEVDTSLIELSLITGNVETAANPEATVTYKVGSSNGISIPVIVHYVDGDLELRTVVAVPLVTNIRFTQEIDPNMTGSITIVKLKSDDGGHIAGNLLPLN